MKLLLFLFTLLLVTPSLAATHDHLADPALEARAVALGTELRCVVCQAQSINDSEATMARDLRRLVRERIAAGDSDTAIRDYVRQRYGDFILLRPPVQQNTYLLWLFPALITVGGGWWVIRFIRQQRKRS